MSDFAASSDIGVLAEELRVTRRVVASSLMCLAPFSQYSFLCRLPGSGSGQCAAGTVDPVGLVDAQQVDRRSHQRRLLE